jgi:hypothetical protein
MLNIKVADIPEDTIMLVVEDPELWRQAQRLNPDDALFEYARLLVSNGRAVMVRRVGGAMMPEPIGILGRKL